MTTLATALRNAVEPHYSEQHGEWVLFCGGQRHAEAILEAARKQLADTPQAACASDGWRPIESKLPERGEYVLTFNAANQSIVGFLPKLPDPAGATEYMRYTKRKDIPQFYHAGTRDPIVWAVTHWQPLPLPPAAPSEQVATKPKGD